MGAAESAADRGTVEVRLYEGAWQKTYPAPAPPSSAAGERQRLLRGTPPVILDDLVELSRRGHDLSTTRMAARWHGPDVFCRASLDAGKRLAQRVKTHRAQAERLGVKVLEAEGSSGPCHGILPGL